MQHPAIVPGWGPGSQSPASLQRPQSVNTGQIHPSQRIAAWIEALQWLTNFTSAIDFNAVGEAFVARAEFRSVSDLLVSSIAASGHRLQLQPLRTPGPPTPMLLILQTKGSTSVTRSQQVVQVGSGQIAIVPLDKTVTLSNDQPVEHLLLAGDFSDHSVAEWTPPLDEVHLVSGQTVSQGLLRGMLQALMSNSRQSDPAQERFLASTLCWLLGQVVADPGYNTCAGINVSRAARTRIVRYIEDNLQDPGLSPERIAKAMGMSKRTLHRAFQGSDEGESINRYIWRRRVERCAAEMRSTAPVGRRQTVTEIAYSFGFSSSAHFSRRFKQHLGVTPLSFRQVHA